MSAGQTNLLTSWEEQEESLEGGFRVTRISIGGDRHAMAILAAVVEQYNFLAERPRPSEDDLHLLVGNKVTLVRTGENMVGGGLFVAQEGKLFATPSGLGILPKGARSKGFRVQPEKVLDVFPGYDTDSAIEVVGRVRSYFPQVRQLTQERLEEMPSQYGETSHALGLCLFGTYRMPDGHQTDALVLMGEYDKENDIVDGGVVLLRPSVGVSEHGSAYGRDLLHTHVLGEVVGYEPISFAEGIELCNLEFEEAYRRVIGPTLMAVTAERGAA